MKEKKDELWRKHLKSPLERFLISNFTLHYTRHYAKSFVSIKVSFWFNKIQTMINLQDYLVAFFTDEIYNNKKSISRPNKIGIIWENWNLNSLNTNKLKKLIEDAVISSLFLSFVQWLPLKKTTGLFICRSELSLKIRV